MVEEQSINMKKRITLKEYQKFCQGNAGNMGNKKIQMMIWGLGIAGEAGDVAGCIKKMYRDKSKDFLPGIKENLGDTLWYIAAICNTLGWTLDEVLTDNVKKLGKRYPEGWNRKISHRGGRREDWNEK